MDVPWRFKFVDRASKVFWLFASWLWDGRCGYEHQFPPWERGGLAQARDISGVEEEGRRPSPSVRGRSTYALATSLADCAARARWCREVWVVVAPWAGSRRSGRGGMNSMGTDWGICFMSIPWQP